MPNAELAAYIAAQRAAGLTDDVIRQAVLTAGWSEDLVSEAFAPIPPAVSTITSAQDTSAAPLLHSEKTLIESESVPLARKVAAGLTWLTAVVFSFHALISTVALYIIATALKNGGMTLSLLSSTTMLTQQPFILAAFATMLFWLGRGMWVGIRKLAILLLLVLVLAIAAWVGMQTVLAAEFARVTGSLTTVGQFAPGSFVGIWRALLSPAVLASVVTALATVIAFPLTTDERQALSLKAKLLLGAITAVVFGTAVAVTLLITVWSVDRDYGLKNLQPTLNYTVHSLTRDSAFVMETIWQLAKTQTNEPSPAVQATAFPKVDTTASPSAQRSIVIRQYPKTPDVSPAMALNFDPQGQVMNPKQVPLKSGTMAVVNEKQFGQGKITTLAFEAPDGVLVRLTSIRAQLPEIIQLADELNQVPTQK